MLLPVKVLAAFAASSGVAIVCRLLLPRFNMYLRTGGTFSESDGAYAFGPFKNCTLNIGYCLFILPFVCELRRKVKFKIVYN